MVEWPDGSHFSVKRDMTARLEFAKRHLKTLRPWETRFSGLGKQRYNWHHPYGETWWWQHHAVGMFFSGRDWEPRIEGKMNRAKYREIVNENLLHALRTSDWGEGSPSNRTTTLSTQPRQRRSGFGNVSECP